MTATLETTAGPEKISFTGTAPGDFAREMKANVERYFTTRNVSQHANWQMVLKTFALLALTFVPYALILTNQYTPWRMLEELAEMGFRLAIYPGALLAPAASAMVAELARMTGRDPGEIAAVGDTTGPVGIFGLVGLADWLELGERYR